MNQLLEKFREFREIVNYQFEYEFDNGVSIKFKLKQSNFPHLIGLHKLTDIPIIRQFNDRNNQTVSATYLIGKIRQQRFLTEETVKYILFEQKNNTAYNHLCVAENPSGQQYAESFFTNSTNLYIHNQHILKVKKVRILNDTGNIYLEESFD
ncbi:MAG: PBECR4 domain-containing protein [Lachnospiraceae bacterium]